MKSTLKSLTLRYFKGVHNLKLDFKEGQNFIHGANEAFKTTVFDSVWWLFFGKDSTGRTDFNIKTLDRETGEVIEKVDHSVKAECDIDGLERSFERIYKETWKKGEDKLKGHTTEFNIDDYPVPDPQKSNFDKAINELFSEETFKLLTNPLYLYTDKKMDMANRRRIVLGLAGPVDREQVISEMETTHPDQKKHIQELRDILKVQQDIAAIKLKITRDKKALNDAKLGIDDRIDENLRKIDAEPDWTVFEKQIEAKKKEIKDLDAQIFDVSNRAKDTNKKKLQLQDEIYMLQKRMNLLKNEATTKAEEANKGQGKDIEEAKESIKQLTKKLEGFESEKKTIEERVKNGDKSIKDAQEEIERYEVQRKELRTKFEETKKTTFEVTGDCPYCGTDLETVESFSDQKESEFK
ncbi:MAG: AAA family ATPase, partial [Planktothrix sp.]